jgi:hypothetical protein
MALSALAFELYFPIIFMPGSIVVTTEHVWVVVFRPTKYVPLTKAKAGVTNAPIRTAATIDFLMSCLLGTNCRPNGSKRIL